MALTGSIPKSVLVSYFFHLELCMLTLYALRTTRAIHNPFAETMPKTQTRVASSTAFASSVHGGAIFLQVVRSACAVSWAHTSSSIPFDVASRPLEASAMASLEPTFAHRRRDGSVHLYAPSGPEQPSPHARSGGCS